MPCPGKKIISCTALIIYSETPRKQDRFSCNNTRMRFRTSVITSCCKCATKMRAAKAPKYRPGEPCGVWSGAGTAREEDAEDTDRATVARADKGAAGRPGRSSHTTSATLSHECSQLKPTTWIPGTLLDSKITPKTLTLKALSLFLSQRV